VYRDNDATVDGLDRFVLAERWSRAAGLRRRSVAMDGENANERLEPCPAERSTSSPEITSAETAGAVTDFPIVGIGASAGGLESLERLFSHLPTDTGMAFVVLQHLSPDFKSLMDELLARRTSMRIRQAEHGLRVEPNSVYLLPPMKEMILRDRKLLLSDRDPRHGLALPIDHFFRSLAQDVGDRAVAVILSGSGSDGSRGIQEVRRVGGVVFCEAPETAKFNGMPLSAIATNAVDQVLVPEDIASAMAALAHPSSVMPRNVDEIEGNDLGVGAILHLLRDEYGIDFSHYKASTVTRRIERRLALNRSIDLDTYVEQVQNDSRELNSLYEDLLIGVTRFFRDEEAFELLAQRIIPEIIERAKPGDPDDQIRVWIPGCATGQEAYSIAMLFHEQLSARRRPVNLKILATDVHRASLEVASAGIYTEQQVAGISPQRLERFFTLKPNGYQISQNLRESIVFAPHNLIRDSPFTKLDLIACRNLLIYLQPHAQKTVFTLFHFALKTGGFLFLGSSESPGGLLDEFETMDDHSKVYRKRRDIRLPPDLKLPLPRAGAAARFPAPTSGRGPAVTPQLLSVYDRLLEWHMPPSFLVDEHAQLIDTYGGAASLLRIKERRPTQNLLEMIGDELRTVISGALHRVRRDGEAVRYEAVAVPALNGRYALVARPIRDAQGALTNVLVSFAEPESPTTTPLPSSGPDQVLPAVTVPSPSSILDLDGLSRDQMRALQDELSFTKENLQSAIQELETTNEELQATNEELVASNEELQSTNEELHSVNEELYTVNAEYQKKNAELQELNDDIEHLLNGTEVATLFLDRELCIRKFTPRIAETFHVIPNDIGRPLRTFTHDLDHPELMAAVERVLRDGVTAEAQTWDKIGRCYFLRIVPYRGRIKDSAEAGRGPHAAEPSLAPDGVVLTLTDISALEQARSKVAQLSAIVESSDDAIISSSLDGIITSWNNGASRLYGYSAEEAIGRHVSFLSQALHRAEIDDVLRNVRDGRSVDRVETTRVRNDGSIVDVSVTFSPILGASGHVVGVSAISRDITQLVRARHEVAEREERIRLLLDSTAEAIYGIDLSGVCTFCNPACARLLGYESPSALIGKQLHPLIQHTRRDGTPYPPEQSPIYEAMRHRDAVHVDDEVFWRTDATSFPAEYWSHPIYRKGEIIGAVVTFLDITERRKAEEEIQEGVRRREQFLAMLSHELRNPLSAILSATRIIGGASGWGNDACQEAGRVVERQANHMARLLDDLLDVSRITHGRIVLRTELVDLREAAQSAIEALGPLMAEHETQLTVDICSEPLPVNGDGARLQQIQANLLSNASKYTHRGGHVRFELRKERGNAVIRVSDDGRGIEPELLPRIFDLFVQGEQSIARREGGLGIGLTLLKSLAELHNGRVTVHSEGPDRGSEFTVTIPLASEAVVTEADGQSGTSVRTVVLVEDQDDARRMMQLLLETEGVTVATAKDGKEGAELIEQLHPDVALVDLGLPVMSGFDLARRVRQNPANHRTRLIALSGYGQDSDIRAAADAGFDQHLTKPPDPERLERALAGTDRDLRQDPSPPDVRPREFLR
jgi:two-component system CheB/CheR fusion protein